MDKETENRLTRLELKESQREEDRREWNKLIREIVVKAVLWLLGVGMAGVMFGWHLPSEVRKWLADQLTK